MFRKGCHGVYGYWPSDAELMVRAEANERERRVERERAEADEQKEREPDEREESLYDEYETCGCCEKDACSRDPVEVSKEELEVSKEESGEDTSELLKELDIYMKHKRK